MMHAVFLLFCCGLKGDTTLDRQEHWDRKRGHQEKKKKGIHKGGPQVFDPSRGTNKGQLFRQLRVCVLTDCVNEEVLWFAFVFEKESVHVPQPTFVICYENPSKTSSFLGVNISYSLVSRHAIAWIH